MLIENEKRSITEQYFHDAWSELTDHDFEPDMIAEVFIEIALKQLVAERGYERASKLLSHLNELDKMGILPNNRTLQ